MRARAVKIYTIGFTRKSASDFFGLLRGSGAVRLVDVRLKNVSQLAGFAKRGDLEYFLETICRMQYVHLPELAPTSLMLAAYRKGHIDWHVYEREFLALMDERGIASEGMRMKISNACLLCSEPRPERCHRRLVAEYLNWHWGDVEIVHLS